MKKYLLIIATSTVGVLSFAQIIYTDITDVTLTPTTSRESLDIDFNNDGTIDYTIFALDTTISSFDAKGIGIDMHGNNKIDANIQTIGTYDFLAATNFQSSQAINNSGNYMSSDSGNLAFPGGVLGFYATTIIGPLNAGNFINTVDNYVGTQFEINGAIHYGWIQMDVANQATSAVVKGFAYESTSNQSINSGQTSNSIHEQELEKAIVIYQNNELIIRGIPGEYEASIIDLLGKTLMHKNLSENTKIILDNMNYGIYLVQLTKGTSVVTKKVYVQ